MKPHKVETDAAPGAIGPYSQAVVAGELVFVSGQIPLDPATSTVVGGGIVPQTERVLRNLQGVLEAAGSDLSRVVKTTVYLRDLGDFRAMNETYARFFGDPAPARAAVQVARLPREVDVEIEAVALLGS